MQVATKKRIGILRGGKGKHYNASLKRGGEVIKYISGNLGDKYSVIDILVDKDGVWHVGGLPETPHDLVHKVDIVWNVSDQEYSNIFKSFSVPLIGASAFSESLEHSADLLREHIKNTNMQMPRSLLFPVYQKDFDGPSERYSIKKAKEVHEKFGAPWIVKSLNEDKSMGIHLAKTFNELVGAIEDGVEHKQSILVEEFIAGRVASVHSVRGFRDQDFYTFPLGNSYGVFSGEEKENLQSIAQNLHQHLGAEHYLKSDFILTPRNKVYLLGISLHPDLNTGSHFSEVCDLVGTKMHQVVENILSQSF
jgi:D-alanine-D-alanine ligase-like ATP-grasp enzyme